MPRPLPSPARLLAAPLLAAALTTGCTGDRWHPHCFPGDMMVATPTGEQPIGALGTGDVVWSVDLATGQLTPARVAFRWDTFTNALVDVTAPEAKVTTTPTHPFRDAVTERWVRAGDLDPGHALMVRDRDLVVSATAEVSPERAVPPLEVHSLSVEGPHRNFIAGGFVVGQ